MLRVCIKQAYESGKQSESNHLEMERRMSIFDKESDNALTKWQMGIEKK